MKPATIIQAAKGDDVHIYLSDTESIKVAGEQAAVNRWRPLLAEHKAEIVRHLQQVQAKGKEEIEGTTTTTCRNWTPGWPHICQCGEKTGFTTGGVPACPSCAGPDPTADLGIGPQEDVASHAPASDVMAYFHIGFPWLKDHLAELLAAGWTRRELFGRGRYKWPIGSWGVAWLSSWGHPCKVASIGRRGEIVFAFMVNGEMAQQSAWPTNSKTNSFGGRNFPPVAET